ncbi:MAG TPA: hypothetical protein VK625_00150 [Flavitalea sp.]|nr:hypothetical protein [Flavitalea sp.]
MRKIFIATVQIAVVAEDTSEACDSISACLTENLMQSHAIVDWTHKEENGIFPDPVYVGQFPDQTDEGEIFDSLRMNEVKA